MDIILTYSKENHDAIVRIETPERYPDKTVEELKAQALAMNLHYGYVAFKYVTIPDEYEDIFNFFLGCKLYKTYASFDSALGDIDEIKSTLNEINLSLNDTFEEVRVLREEVKKYAKEEISSLNFTK